MSWNAAQYFLWMTWSSERLRSSKDRLTVRDQSFGLQTTLNLGAAEEFPIRHSSTSRPKKQKRSSVISFSQSRAARCSSAKARRDPNDGYSLKASCVREQLPQVDVIRSLELVFDQDPGVGAQVLAEDVGTERDRRASLQPRLPAQSLTSFPGPSSSPAERATA